MLLPFLKCKFNNPSCEHNPFGCKCGKGGKSAPAAPAPVPSAAEIAQQQIAAQTAAIPQAAQLNYNVLTSPQYGLGATTAEYERVRQQQYPEETAVRNQLVQNVLASLISPTGVTPEQQAAVDARRGLAQNELINALRERANLGGGLYGGRAGRTEERAVGEMQSGFATEDIARQESARLNAINAALPILQMLYPEVSLMQPQYINPVPGADTSLQAALSARGQDIDAQMAQQQAQSGLMSALFGGLGTAAGGALGGPLGGALGKSLFKKPQQGQTPGTLSRRLGM